MNHENEKGSLPPAVTFRDTVEPTVVDMSWGWLPITGGPTSTKVTDTPTSVWGKPEPGYAVNVKPMFPIGKGEAPRDGADVP